MNFYLSSYKLGDRTDALKKWINEHGNKICLIPNSRDIYPESERKANGIKEDVCDDPNINPYGIDTMWDGLGYFDYIFLPHYKSNHKETELIDASVEYCNQHNIKYKPLKDGDVIIHQIERRQER